jgi:hypothetical protein
MKQDYLTNGVGGPSVVPSHQSAFSDAKEREDRRTRAESAPGGTPFFTPRPTKLTILAASTLPLFSHGCEHYQSHGPVTSRSDFFC